MDVDLTASESAFRDELRAWLDQHLIGEFREVVGRGGPDDDDAWDVRRRWDRELGAGNWIGITWPTEYGGRSAPLSHEVILQMELAAAGAPARGAFHGETLLAPTLLSHGSEDQKHRLLPPMARGEVVWCQGYSEPGAGSDLAAVSTKAAPCEGGWLVNGQKIWTTFAHHAEWIFALVRTTSGSSRHAGLSYVLLELDQRGVEVRPIKTLTGDSAFNEVYLTDAFVATENVVGAEGDGWRVAMSTLGHERATSVLGHQYSFQRELAALHDLMKRNGTIHDDVLADRLAQSYIELEVIQANNLRVLANATGRGEFGPESSIGKYLWSTWHQDFAALALDVMGTDALLEQPEDHVANELLGAYLRSRAETIYAGTTQIQLNVIAERVLGLPREPR